MNTPNIFGTRLMNPQEIAKIDTTSQAPIRKTVVWYHDQCADGTCAAWVASKYLPEDTEFVPQNYGKPIQKAKCITNPEDMRNTDLYILDWCPESMEKLQEIIHRFGSVVLIDHHESAIKKFDAHFKLLPGGDGILPENLTVFLAHENEWSGAMGAAMYFSRTANENRKGWKLGEPNGLTDHWLVKAMDDRDRWQWKLPMTREIYEGVMAMAGTDLAVWRRTTWDLTLRTDLMMVGEALIKKQEQQIKVMIAQNLQVIYDVEHQPVAAVLNIPYSFHSDIGEALNREYPVVICWYATANYKTKFGFRSNKENPDAIDCAQLAALVGGGGHKHAAGAVLDMPSLDALERVYDAVAQV